MPSNILEIANTFNCPNYVGELYQVTPSDTPFLSAIGGMDAGEMVNMTEFQWQESALRAPGQNVKLEGADAPTAETAVRDNITNITEIHQETIGVTYTKQAATGQYAGANIAGINPVMNEIDWQTEQMLKQVARDIEYSFINGVYQKPMDNTTPRKTRGMLQAILTNVITNASPTALTANMVLDLLQMVWDSGGIAETDTATIIANSVQKRALTQAFITDKNYQEQSRTVGGVRLQTIDTDFGTLNIMLNRYMPQDQLMVASLEMCVPVFTLIPGKGFLFTEPLAKTGSTDRSQIYTEPGLKYGNERAHGKITGLKVS